MRKENHRPPSRIKYEKAHPTISARVSQELYEEIKAFLATTNQSLADLLLIALGKHKPDVDKAFEAGSEIATQMYRIVFKCPGCGEEIEVMGEQILRSAGMILSESGWGHIKCTQNPLEEQDE
ncbi:hypothetical protein [Dehalogenimonas alkenigignens]|uniref:hypothetical protein n=1 Tax=Dehalogenimonas alkenigignens TaxID=1217799 RepID=UPI000D570189|nr:hypothetical protein [Dehalogenimonas alkenigignens]PVV83301.1 hypothetical protein DD509_06930 [Dehalogenimonas alkenigignens]